MKFEFKMLPGKPVKKEPPQHPNPFELLKTGEKQKEIITGIPISTDAFGRTLYQTPNGQFRAIGDSYNLYANVFQTQNNLITLAPPPDDDEEDTMPKQKPKRNIGTLIIVPPPVVISLDLCFVMGGGDGERVYRIKLGKELEDTILEEIFNCPPGFEPYNWWTNLLAFGFFENTALALGYDKDWAETIFRVDYKQNIVSSVAVDSIILYTSKFTYYDKNLYFAHFDYSNKIIFKKISNDFSKIEVINEIPYSGSLISDNFFVWQKFIVYLESSTIKIYDFIGKKVIANISVEEDTNSEFNFVNANDELACFIWTYAYQTNELKEQHFIVLKKDGTYKDIIREGIHGGIDAVGNTAILYYYPHYLYASSFGSEVLFLQNGMNHIVSKSYIWEKTDEDYRYKAITPTIENTSAACFLDNQTVLIGTSSTNLSKGARIYRVNLSKINDFEDLGKLGADDERGIMTLRQSPSGRLFAMTQEYYVGLEAWSPIGKAYKSDDLGEQWQLIDAYGIWDVMCFENGKIFFETNYNYWNVSADDGDTWTMFVNEGRYEEPYYGVIEWKDRENVYLEAYGIIKIENNFIKIGADTSVDIMSRRVCISTDGGYNWTQISTVPERVYPVLRSGSSFIRRTTRPHYKEIQMVYEIDGIIFYTGIAIRDGQERFVLYRSADGGYTWTNVWENHPNSFIYSLAKDSNGNIIGMSSSLGSYFWVSEDNGLTWEELQFKIFDDTYIETYSLAGSPIMLKITVWKDHPIPNYQQKIGANVFSKIYNGKFYFDRNEYDINTEDIQVDVIEYGTSYLWLGDYLLYSGTDDKTGNYGFFIKDMRTGTKKNLNWGKDPYFFPEHLSAYYLR